MARQIARELGITDQIDIETLEHLEWSGVKQTLLRRTARRFVEARRLVIV